MLSTTILPLTGSGGATGSAAAEDSDGSSFATRLLCIPPPHRLEPFEKPHRAVEHEPDDTDDDHAGDDQVVTVAGVARVHDHVTEAGSQSDHLRRDDDEPRDA